MEPNAAGQTSANDRRKRLSEGRRTTAPIAIVTRGKTTSFSTKNESNFEADTGTREPGEPSSWRFLLACNRLTYFKSAQR